MFVYAATALKPDQTPIVGFVRAANPDDAMSKALHGLLEKFGSGGKVTHVVPISRGTPEALKRNGLATLLPLGDQVEFLTDYMLLAVRSMERIIERLRTQLVEAMERVKADELRSFSYTIVCPWGESISCLCNARDLEHAREQAEFWAADLHPDCKVLGPVEESK